MKNGNWIWLVIGLVFLGAAIITWLHLSVSVATGLYLFLLAVGFIIYFFLKGKKS